MELKKKKFSAESFKALIAKSYYWKENNLQWEYFVSIPVCT